MTTAFSFVPCRVASLNTASLINRVWVKWGMGRNHAPGLGAFCHLAASRMSGELKQSTLARGGGTDRCEFAKVLRCGGRCNLPHEGRL